MNISEFQKLIYDIYYEKDSKRGLYHTFVWFIEEVGELARAIKEEKNLEKEFADTLAWLVQLANMKNINIEKCISIYKEGCPVCKNLPCKCKV